jgi:hypothetical protein
MKQTFKYWIYAQPTGSRMVYTLSDIEWGDFQGATERVLIGAHTITHELPDISESVPAVVAKLEAKKLAMQATAAAAIAEVDGQIQSLMAIGQEVSA